jgi:CheY-like chemotaxis protein
VSPEVAAESATILIVDDHPTNRKLLAVVLAGRGYHLLAARSAEEALELLRDARPRLLLVDLQLPGMDGLELTRRLRADAAHAALVIVAVTAYAMKGDEDRARAAGCDAYITKPIDTRALPGTVAALLARGRS